MEVVTSEGEEVEGIKTYRVLPLRDTKSVLGNFKRLFGGGFSEIEKILKNNKYDVIHLIGESVGFAKKIKKITKTPVFYTCESYIALCPKGDFMIGDRSDVSEWGFIKTCVGLMKSEELGTMKNVPTVRYNPLVWLIVYCRYRKLRANMLSTNIVSVSKYVHDLVKKLHKRDSFIVPNFVPDEFFRYSKARCPKHLLFLGSATQFKGIRTLLRAIKDMNITLHVYGRKTSEYTQSNVHWHEPVSYDKLPEIINKATILITPSIWPEPFGRTPIEAGACKTMAIVSDSGALPETSDITFRAGDWMDLRDKITYFLAKPKIRRLAEIIHQDRAENRYSEEVVINKLIKVYEELF